MYKIIQKRNYLFAFSLLILIPGMIGLGLWGLDLGIDFRGGSLMTMDFKQGVPTTSQVAEIVKKQLPNSEVVLQPTGDNSYMIRLPELNEAQHQQIVTQLTASFSGSSELSYESVGPTLGQELKQKAVLALVFVFAAIIIYITWAFRRVSQGPVPSWVYGVSAFLAMFHDLLMVVGVFAIIGHYLFIQVDSLFITALLTVLGFSVHDTIVVFDRIRERLITHSDSTYEEAVNISLNQTMVRSLNTSLTTLLVLAALLFFGGQSIRNFVLALFIGIASGTYSSIFIASPLLVVWQKWSARK